MDSKKIDIAAGAIKESFEEKKVELNKIIIYGSSAYLSLKDCNDIDIIIISKSFRKKNYDERLLVFRNLNRDLVKKTNKPVDILYYSDEEWKDNSSLIIREAKRNGRVIYSA